MKINKLLIIAGILAVSLTSCWENVEDIQGSGPSVAPGVVFVVFDADGNREAGVTVEVYASYENYIDGASALGTGTTDESGEAEFGTDALGTEASSFYVSAYSGGFAAVSWDGTVSTGLLLLTTGKTPVVLNLDAPAYSTEISGADALVAGATSTYSLADYPGTYSWTSSNSARVTFSDATLPSPSVTFSQESFDETITLFVEVTTGSDPTQTLSIDVDVTRFCDYDAPSWSAAFYGLDGGGLACYGDITTDGNDAVFTADASGYPFFLRDIFIGWGESADPGVGNELNTMATFSDEGVVTIPEQYWGSTLDGLYSYWIRGSGTFDQCTQVMTISSLYISYNADYTSGTTRATEGAPLVLTLD